MSTLSHGQDIIARNYLADYPDDATFAQILMMLEESNEEVSVWYPFEEWDIQMLINHMAKLANAIDNAVIESKNEG